MNRRPGRGRHWWSSGSGRLGLVVRRDDGTVSPRRVAAALATSAATMAMAVVLAVVGLPADAASAAAAVGVPGARANDGASVVSETVVGPRMLDLVVNSPAVGRNLNVRLLLPPSYFAQPSRTFPTLYLLHGCCEPYDYQAWTQFTDVEEFTADKEALVVMPTDDSAGMYTNWYNQGRGTPGWETFHTVELPQILERGYRAGPNRAVAGLSIGGLGAFKYAANHPGMFRAAASYSGLTDTMSPTGQAFVLTILLRVGADLNGPWGSIVHNNNLWAASNPYSLAPKLRGVGLYLSSGNGWLGPLDPPNAVIDPIEMSSDLINRGFVQRLRRLGIPATVNLYGNGTHSWPYWQREFKASWPVLARGLGI